MDDSQGLQIHIRAFPAKYLVEETGLKSVFFPIAFKGFSSYSAF